jgi:hypothetical protein
MKQKYDVLRQMSALSAQIFSLTLKTVIIILIRKGDFYEKAD